jgi:hypothetical protein
MATYAYTDVIYGYEADGVRPKKIKAGDQLTPSKETGLTKEDIDEMVERGSAGDDKHVPVAPNDMVHQAATLEEREEGIESGSVASERSNAGR